MAFKNNNIIVDIDECSVSNGGCGHTCNNNQGSYSCTCNTGYYLNSTNGETCHGRKIVANLLYWLQLTDINECNSGSSDCEQVCTNTVGSFTCSCNTGYSLASGKFCRGMYMYTCTKWLHY